MVWPTAPIIIPLCVVFVLVVLLCLIVYKLVRTLSNCPSKRDTYPVEKVGYGPSKKRKIEAIPYTIDPTTSTRNVKRSTSPGYSGLLSGIALGALATAPIRTPSTERQGSDADEYSSGGGRRGDGYNLDTVDDASEQAVGIITLLGESSSDNNLRDESHQLYAMRTMTNNNSNSSITDVQYNRHEVHFEQHYYGGGPSGSGDHYESDV